MKYNLITIWVIATLLSITFVQGLAWSGGLEFASVNNSNYWQGYTPSTYVPFLSSYYLNLSGTNANQNINVSPYNITAAGIRVNNIYDRGNGIVINTNGVDTLTLFGGGSNDILVQTNTYVLLNNSGDLLYSASGGENYFGGKGIRIGTNLTVENGNIYSRNVCYSNGTNCIAVSTFNSSYAVLSYNHTNVTLNILNATNCPTGNYSFGIFQNGSLKCRSDNSGASSGDGSYNASYLPYQGANDTVNLNNKTILNVTQMGIGDRGEVTDIGLTIRRPQSGAPYYSQMLVKANKVNEDVSIALESSRNGNNQSWFFGSGSGGATPNNNFRIVDLTNGLLDGFNIEPGTPPRVCINCVDAQEIFTVNGNQSFTWGFGTERRLVMQYDPTYEMGLKFEGDARNLTVFNKRNDANGGNIILQPDAGAKNYLYRETIAQNLSVTDTFIARNICYSNGTGCQWSNDTWSIWVNKTIQAQGANAKIYLNDSVANLTWRLTLSSTGANFNIISPNGATVFQGDNNAGSGTIQNAVATPSATSSVALSTTLVSGIMTADIWRIRNNTNSVIFAANYTNAAGTKLKWMQQNGSLTNCAPNQFGVVVCGNDPWTQNSVSVSAGTSSVSAKVGGSLFDNSSDISNSNGDETNLYLNSIAANILASTNDKIEFKYVGNFTSNPTATKEVRVYFNNTKIYDSGAVALSTDQDWELNGIITRTGSTTAEASVTLQTSTASTLVYSDYTALTGLNFAAALPLNITGQSAGVGAATGQINIVFGTGEWRPGV